MSKHIVATVNEIPVGGRKLVEVEGRSIGVFNLGAEFFALKSRCPHQGGPLCEGKVGSLVEADAPGDYALSRPGEMLRCPWHGWEFDIRTGQSWWRPARMRVAQYPVTVEDGAALQSAGWQKGPYVAETYRVEVNQQYVLVEINSLSGRKP
jgi:3-phenylpropionate/trans-cinnamate dioxygenase ferredoxin subunit